MDAYQNMAIGLLLAFGFVCLTLVALDEVLIRLDTRRANRRLQAQLQAELDSVTKDIW